MSKKYILVGVVVIIVLPVVALAWWLLSPLLVDQTVEEELPFAAQAVVPADMTRAEVEDVMSGMAKLTRPVDEPMPDKMMMSAEHNSAGSPTTASPDIPVDKTIPDKTKMGAKDGSSGSSATTASGSSGTALVLSKGTFQDADRFHQGSGEATIYRGPDGSYLLRLENFQVTNGPDLHVILSPSPAPESRDDVHQPGYLDLGSLKGNRGNQNYEIPADVDVNAWSSVVIYCAPFHVVFSVALLKTAG